MILFVLSIEVTLAQDAVRVLSRSKSGQSLIINTGRLEGIHLKSLAKIYTNVGTEKFPNIKFVGNAEVVKLEETKSYWFLKKPAKDIVLKREQVVLLYLRDKAFDGLGNLKVTQKKIIMPVEVGRNKINKSIEKGVPEDLIMAEDGFTLGRKLLKKKIIGDGHIISTDVGRWKTSRKKIYDHKKDKEYKLKRIKDLSKVKNVHDIKSIEEDYIYESMIKGSTQKVNDLYYGIAELYQEQKRDKDVNELKEKSDFLNLYDQRRKKITEAKIQKDKAYDYIQVEGPLWSNSMDDNQLRRFIHTSGIAHENTRKYNALKARLGHEFIFGLSSMLTNSTTVDDPNNRSNSYSLDLGYELHLERLTTSLASFGWEVFLKKGVSFYPLSESINGKFQMGGFSTAINFYIYNRPTALNKLIWYAGAGIFRGEATVTSVELSKDYSYNLYSFPIFQTGLKYRFSNINDYYGEAPIGLGLSVKYSMSQTNVSVVDVISDEDILDGSKNFTESKLSLAVNVYF